jgi:EmrB/QacA subfamily drug resistance transporter
MIGMVGFAGSSAGCGLVGSTTGLIAFRALQGIFGALLLPNTLALLRSAFPPRRLNMAVGIWGGASAISIAAGPIVGGLLVQHVSWQSVFYINVPIALIALAVALVVVSESRDPAGSRFDPPGIAALAAGLLCVVYAIIKAETWGWGSGRTLGLLFGGAAILGAFVLIESRVRAPLLPLRLFRSRALSISTVVQVLGFFALFGQLIYVTLYLQNVHGFSPVQAGVRELPLTAIFMVSAPLGGLLNEHFGPRAAIVPAMLLVGLGLLSFLGLKPDSSYIHLWPGFAAVGLGFGVATVTASDEIVAGAPVDQAGIAGGITSTAQQLGGVIGTGLLGSLLASRVASTLGGHLTAAGVPAGTAHALSANHNVTQLVAQGVAPPVRGISAAASHAVAAGSHQAFVSGLHTAMLVTACACFVASGLGLLLSARKQSQPAGTSLEPAIAEGG